MGQFRHDGHLTDEALLSLIQGGEQEELDRLEIAEHLAYCDQCLQRYTELLTDEALLTPAHSCQESIWARIRIRALRLVTSRYATAAAAVALALTLLWGGAGLSGRVQGEHSPFFHRAGSAVTEWAGSWSQSLEEAFDHFNIFFDNLGGSRPQTMTQGGIHS